MGLKRIEQEVIISFNAEEGNATIYSSYPPYIRKLDKIANNYPSICQLIEESKSKSGELISRTYTINKRLVSVRRPRNATTTNNNP